MAVYKSNVKPAMLYGSEAQCLKESEIGILHRTERSMVRAMSGVQLKYRKRSTYLMFILGLSHTMEQLAITNSVCWYGHVLRREDGHHLLLLVFPYALHKRGGCIKLPAIYMLR